MGSFICTGLVGISRKAQKSVSEVSNAGTLGPIAVDLKIVSSDKPTTFTPAPLHLDLASTSPPYGLLDWVTQTWLSFCADFRKGLHFVLAERNRHITGVLMVKGCGCLCFGVADVLYFK